MDSDFNITIKILNALIKTLTIEKVQSALESKELELFNTTVKGETTQFVGRGRKGNKGYKGNNILKTQDNGNNKKEEYLKQARGCQSYGGVHFKHDYVIWRQTKAGKTWLASAKGKAKLA